MVGSKGKVEKKNEKMISEMKKKEPKDDEKKKH
jgi:hypothetical protein